VASVPPRTSTTGKQQPALRLLSAQTGCSIGPVSTQDGDGCGRPIPLRGLHCRRRVRRRWLDVAKHAALVLSTLDLRWRRDRSS
jgi:hypothetical protein